MTFIGPPEPASLYDYSRQAAEEAEARELGIGWKVGPAAANLFDAWATQDALKRGGQEANPLMKGLAEENPAAFYGVKLGTGILAGLAADRLAKAGHPKWARFVSGINVAVPLGLGAHNLAGGRD